MNKAFVREPEFDGKAYCPRCGSLGTEVSQRVLEQHVVSAAKMRLGDSAWYCSFAACDTAYFNLFEQTVRVNELTTPPYPKDPAAPVCPCFGFSREDIEADIQEGNPTRIRGLLTKSKSPEANCRLLAADGKCCMAEVQRLYMRGIAKS